MSGVNPEPPVSIAATSSHTASITLPTDDQILITRLFDAPRHLVYRAWVTPELVKRWWASDLGKVTLAEVDLQVGGRWRYVMVTHTGLEVGFHGVFQQIVPHELLVSTELFEGMPEGTGALNTITFADAPGGTLLSLLVQHNNREERDYHLHSGMEWGMQKALNFLEEVAKQLA
ncbi:SRPBCC family protein [Deinococcus roseus]|uniref:Activator of Hsp90 ATPase homologue 1/2-like C-terminal domain-containing protein n=1 Tax=Deinococcus roseus TaxID=392414 RepID=A0ABQ2D4C6_9DEIO|nr:SRPBCC family protein [Deinococcus roseus]GGJ42712.1 hypothetical protein GCM10008938_31080 [Deinococcus roseus]